uniref:Phosphotyrosine interaction domain containing 1 n=1 Tax=Ursus maritimus TaxID=29073 RepID=A0A452USK2_URSMA
MTAFCSPIFSREGHFQTMLKSKLNVLTLKKEPLPAVIFHEPEAIELCTTTPLMKTRTHSGCKKSHHSSDFSHVSPSKICMKDGKEMIWKHLKGIKLDDFENGVQSR